MLPQLNLISRISKFSGFNADEIASIIFRYHRKYKRYAIPKSSGGVRIILHPAKELKAIQYAIYESVLRHHAVHEIATAYIPQLKSPLRATAQRHASFKYSIRIDFKDFFYSLRPNDLIRQLRRRYVVSDEEIQITSKLLSYNTKGINGYVLPIGAPTSPVISNIAMCELDEMMYALSKNVDSSSTITRYADDIHFSSNIKGKCLEFNTGLEQLLLATATPRLQINTQKTLFLSRGTRRVVTGLFITPDGLISLGRERKKLLKTYLYRHSKGQLSLEEVATAKGLLSFASDCEPAYLNKLALKYDGSYYSIRGK